MFLFSIRHYWINNTYSKKYKYLFHLFYNSQYFINVLYFLYFNNWMLFRNQNKMITFWWTVVILCTYLYTFNYHCVSFIIFSLILLTYSLTPFFIDSVKDDDYKIILDITYILHAKVDEPRKRRDLVQCQNYQN